MVWLVQTPPIGVSWTKVPSLLHWQWIGNDAFLSLLFSLLLLLLLLSILAEVSVGQQRKAPVVSRHMVDSDYSCFSKGMLLVCSNGNSHLLLFVTCWRFRILLVVVVALFLLWVYRGYSIPTNSIQEYTEIFPKIVFGRLELAEVSLVETARTVLTWTTYYTDT